MQTCNFGCGQPAVHRFKSGRVGCNTSPNKCPAMKLKNSTKIAELRYQKGANYWHSGVPHGKGVPTGKKGKTFIELYGEERAATISASISSSLKGKLHYTQTPETKTILSLRAKANKLGGYVPRSGRGKKGWYKGFWCDSSWELAYVIYCLDHNLSIVRNTTKRQYLWNGQVKNYYPDFLVENKLTEIKGYSSPQWEAKLRDNPDVKVLYRDDMLPILRYIINKYGKDYTNLYE